MITGIYLQIISFVHFLSEMMREVTDNYFILVHAGVTAGSPDLIII